MTQRQLDRKPDGGGCPCHECAVADREAVQGDFVQVIELLRGLIRRSRLHDSHHLNGRRTHPVAAAPWTFPIPPMPSAHAPETYPRMHVRACARRRKIPWLLDLHPSGTSHDHRTDHQAVHARSDQRRLRRLHAGSIIRGVIDFRHRPAVTTRDRGMVEVELLERLSRWNLRRTDAALFAAAIPGWRPRTADRPSRTYPSARGQFSHHADSRRPERSTASLGRSIACSRLPP